MWPGDIDKQDYNWLCFFFFPMEVQWQHLDLHERVGEGFTGEALHKLKYEEIQCVGNWKSKVHIPGSTKI